MNSQLPPIPAKRYFTIGEVAELCDVKPHVLRYWEQEFVQLRPMKRRGNRRYYQHHEVLMIRRIRELLYGQGFTINGAKTRLQNWTVDAPGEAPFPVNQLPATPFNLSSTKAEGSESIVLQEHLTTEKLAEKAQSIDMKKLRLELLQIQSILSEKV